MPQAPHVVGGRDWWMSAYCLFLTLLLNSVFVLEALWERDEISQPLLQIEAAMGQSLAL